MKNENTGKSIYDVSISLAFLGLIIAWCLMILLPFVSILLWGLILALALAPLHRMLTRLLRGKKKLASFIIVLIGLAIIIIPTWLFMDSIVDSVKGIKTSFQAGTLTIPPPSEKVKTWPVFGDQLYALWNSASVNLEKTIADHREQLAGFGSKAAKGILSVGGGVLQFIVSLIIAGILLVTAGAGEGIRKVFRKLAGERGDEFADIANKTVGNVVKGILGVAFIQAFLVGLGFVLAKVPYAGLWTLLVFIMAILQLPPTLVVIPVAIYLFSVLNPLPAILWTIYLLLAGISDNVLKPVLLGKGAPVPMLIIFLGVVGGFILSGFIGLFTGAIVLSLGYKLMVSWMNGNQVQKPSDPLITSSKE
ncbi:MAG TPA: AI-2E family transporter [Bacteroidales bacterium]|nr:AI-2E family transporter [Bacteroidales bacterium]HRZ20173.1 AI-2E family transporter [Bacteroidales bacterium]